MGVLFCSLEELYRPDKSDICLWFFQFLSPPLFVYYSSEFPVDSELCVLAFLNISLRDLETKLRKQDKKLSRPLKHVRISHVIPFVPQWDRKPFAWDSRSTRKILKPSKNFSLATATNVVKVQKYLDLWILGKKLFLSLSDVLISSRFIRISSVFLFLFFQS